jgi:hypothetical protein
MSLDHRRYHDARAQGTRLGDRFVFGDLVTGAGEEERRRTGKPQPKTPTSTSWFDTAEMRAPHFALHRLRRRWLSWPSSGLEPAC